MAVALPAVATALAGILIGTAIFLLLRKGGRAAPMEDATSGPSPAAAPGKPIESKHYAWAKDIKQREAEMRALGVDMSPQPVKVAEGAAPSSGAAAGVSRSAWNAAGTWEDRDISARALQTLRARLERFSAVMGDGTFSVTAVNSCTGSVNLACVEGGEGVVNARIFISPLSLTLQLCAWEGKAWLRVLSDARVGAGHACGRRDADFVRDL